MRNGLSEDAGRMRPAGHHLPIPDLSLHFCVAGSFAKIQDLSIRECTPGGSIAFPKPIVPGLANPLMQDESAPLKIGWEMQCTHVIKMLQNH